MNTKIAICLILPCIIALVSCAYLPGKYGYQQPRQVAPYANYAANSYQGLKQAKLFNYLLGGLYFLNLFNVTGNRIAG
ncbi:Hypothetical predicted protein [Mytilus galloprovincialis]|uniref:Uncharacterized protein n=1 Tax=Mytilus galloprovincialis TaxID=29158 RepID=A0A8B6E6P4_MYTGA|nr:Hypothetical predicted protein [Mytilus galloprovincialis]